MSKRLAFSVGLASFTNFAFANTGDTSLLDDLNSYAHSIGSADDLFSTVLDMVAPIHAGFLGISQTLFYALSLLALTYALGNRVFGGRTSPLSQLGAIFLCLVMLSPVVYERSEFTINNTESVSRISLLNANYGGEDIEVSWVAKGAHYLINAVSTSIREAIDWGYEISTGGTTSNGLPMAMFQSLAASQAKHLPESPELRKNYLYYTQLCGNKIDQNTPGSTSDYNLLGLNGGSGLSLNLKADVGLLDNVIFGENPDYYLMAHNTSIGGNDILSYMTQPVNGEAAGKDMSGVLAVLDHWKSEDNTLTGKTDVAVTGEGFKIPSQAYWESTFKGTSLEDPNLKFETVPVLGVSQKPLHWSYFFGESGADQPEDGDKRFYASSCYDLYRIAGRSMLNFQRALLAHQGWDGSQSQEIGSLLPNSIHAYNVLATDRVQLDKIYEAKKEELAGDSSFSGWLLDSLGNLVDEAVAVVAGAGNEIEKVYSDWQVQYWLPVALVTMSLVYGMVFALLPFLILFSVFAGRYGSVILGLQIMIMMHVAYLIAYFFAKAGGLIVQTTLNAATAAFSASTVQAQNILPFTVAGELTIYAGMLASLPLAYIITFNEKMGFKNLSARHTGLQSQLGAAASAAFGGKYVAGKVAAGVAAKGQATAAKAALAASKPAASLKANTGTAAIGKFGTTPGDRASRGMHKLAKQMQAQAAAGRPSSKGK